MREGAADGVRPLTAADAGWAHALNQANVPAVGGVSAERFERLRRAAAAALAAGAADGFALIFDEGSDYDSPNFLWFRERYPRFLYVDRVAVAPERRRRGVARRLYRAALSLAAARGAPVGCEVNVVPPNPVSDAFHDALGFVPVGLSPPGGDGKQVRYRLRPAPGRAVAPPG